MSVKSSTIGSSKNELLGSVPALLRGDPKPERVLEDLYGVKLPKRGVVHITAVARQCTFSRVGGVPRVLKINQHTPKSALDFYSLNAVRAWADVILTSGKILRDEPDLDFTLDGPTEESAAALRASRAGRAPLRVVVLSSGKGLAEAILNWQGEAVPIVFTDSNGAELLASELTEQATECGESGRSGALVKKLVEIETVENSSPRSMLQWVKDQPSWSRVSVELGPSTNSDLYREPALIDRLLLSEYVGETSKLALGAEFLPECDLDGLVEHSSTARFEQLGPAHDQGLWSFRSFSVRSG